MLAVLASAAGVLMATWASDLVVQQLSTHNVPISVNFVVDWRLVTFSIVVATMAILVFGVTPAIRATAVSPIDALKEQSRGAAVSSGWMPDALVVVQIGLSLVLLVGAGLFVRTFVSLASRDPGFTRDRVLLAPIDGRRVSDPLQRVRAYERVRQEVRAVPGVATVSLSFVTPAQNLGFNPPIEVSNGRKLPERERFVFSNLISTDWFSTFDVPIVRGRDFAEGDRIGAEHVAIVNEAFSRRFLDGKDPLGQFITLPDFMAEPSPNIPIRIVGVAADAVYASLRERPQPTMYLPLAQHEEPPFLRVLGGINLVIRPEGGASARLEERVRSAIENIDPRLIVTFRPFAEQLNDSLARERVMATLAGFFGVLAMLLAGLGLYGVTAYAVARRRGEIGIRIALGATPASVIHMVVLRVAILVGSGALLGVGISTWLGRSIASLLYGIQPHDLLTMASSVLTLAVVATLAAWLPAWRASRLDPADVLRET
jgi:predicted permease